MTIALLPDHVINQIAAGEVLENPASGVKELVENSIDAGATEIRIEIEGGGLQRLKVEDDGCGMDRSDAALSVKRHATSKIRAVDDLDRLATMGFRGEALAALASVSMLEMKTSNGTEATRYSESGIETAARNRGTTIEARHLFYNAPARLKFQKSPSACAAAVLKTVQSIALAHPNISFSLYSNGKPTLIAETKDWKKRIEEILGPFAHEISGPGLKGFIGRPEEAKLNRSGQMIYVNRRPIQSGLIARAVKDGFGTRMQESLFPQFILFLEIASDLVDVNVHPQKKEVRFKEEGKIYELVRSSVMRAFDQGPSVSALPWEFTPVRNQWVEPTTFFLEDAPVSLPIEMEPIPKTLLGRFLVVEGLQLVDLRGAEARVLFEQMQSNSPHVQPLMWPVQLNIKDAEEVVEHVKPLYIEARAIGKNVVAIDAMPAGIDLSEVEEFVRSYFSERKLAATLTKMCRSRRKNYSFEEASLIWKQLRKCKDREYDPLGRKIVVEINEAQLAEWFA